MNAPAFMPVKPGSLVASGDMTYRVMHVIGLADVLAEDLATGEPKRLRIDGLRHAAVGATAATAAPAGAATPRPAEAPDLSTVGEADWVVAQTRMGIIKPLLEDPDRTRAVVEAAAAAAGVHFTTLYEWMRLYADSMHLSALIPMARGPRKGMKRVDPKLEAIIHSAIEDEYLTRQKKKPSRVIEAVAKRCKAAGVEPPHANTVRKRIAALPAATTLRRRGRRDVARNIYEPIRGTFPDADFPLALIQVDHSPTNVLVVDDATRRSMGRPWITLAIDVHTRMVAGYHLSMFNPNAYAVGACLAQALLPKREALARLEVPGEWPVFGRPDIVHVDNAKEFRGNALKRACNQYGIELRFRPLKTPHYGGHIERLMGTVANELRNLPGATFESPAERKGYDAEREAALTFGELDAYLLDFFVNVYNTRFHHGIGMSPLRKLEIGILGDGDTPGRGLPEPPGDPERVRIDFLPFEERMVQPYGIVLDKVHYWDEVLTPWINATDPADARRKRTFIVRRDPRLVSPIYFWDPEVRTYYEIHYRDVSRPPTSLWALREAQQLLKAEGQPDGDETALFEALARLDKRVEDAKGETKAVRRRTHRQAQTRRVHAEASRASGGDGSDTAPVLAGQSAGLLDDLFAQPVQRHAHIDLKLGRGRT